MDCVQDSEAAWFFDIRLQCLLGAGFRHFKDCEVGSGLACKTEAASESSEHPWNSTERSNRGSRGVTKRFGCFLPGFGTEAGVHGHRAIAEGAAAGECLARAVSSLICLHLGATLSPMHARAMFLTLCCQMT